MINWSIEKGVIEKTQTITTPNPVEKPQPEEEKTIMKTIEEEPLQYTGILKNVLIKKFLDEGYKIGLNKPYSHETTFEELMQFKKYSLLVIGGRQKGSDQLMLAANGKANVILKETQKIDQANFHNNVYWYFMKKKSFGFSGCEKIYLNEYDEVEEENDEKLSWMIQGNIGGWRLGRIGDLNENENFEKIILFKV